MWTIRWLILNGFLGFRRSSGEETGHEANSLTDLDQRKSPEPDLVTWTTNPDAVANGVGRSRVAFLMLSLGQKLVRQSSGIYDRANLKLL
jgi:hypothetical protein